MTVTGFIQGIWYAPDRESLTAFLNKYDLEKPDCPLKPTDSEMLRIERALVDKTKQLGAEQLQAWGHTA